MLPPGGCVFAALRLHSLSAYVPLGQQALSRVSGCHAGAQTSPGSSETSEIRLVPAPWACSVPSCWGTQHTHTQDAVGQHNAHQACRIPGLHLSLPQGKPENPIKGRSYSTAGRVLVLYTVNLGLIPDIPFGFPRTTGHNF